MEDVVKPLDLGHDDVDGQECKDGRSRTWMILLYPDDPEHKAVLDGKLAELDWNYAGRVHDKDDGVKEHHHVVVLFKDGRKNTDIAKDLGIDKRWLRAWDRQKKAFRYLCHKDNPEKYQYSTDGIYGTMAEKAVGACSKGNELSETQSVHDLVDLLDSIEGFVSYKFFLKLVSEKGLYPVFRRMGNLAVKLIEEHNAMPRKQLQEEMEQANAEMRRESERDMFGRFLTDVSPNIPLARRVDAMEQYGRSDLPLDPL